MINFLEPESNLIAPDLTVHTGTCSPLDHPPIRRYHHPMNFDLLVIGGGSAGVRCARIAAGHGARVGVAESRWLHRF